MAKRASEAANRTAVGKDGKQPPAAGTRAMTAFAAPGPAARSRIKQRKRRQLTRQVRRLEAVLPSVGGGVWRPALPAPFAWHGWRTLHWRRLALLAALLLVVGGLVTWVHSDDRWFLYREDAHFTGLTYLDAEELWPLSEIDGWNLFWLNTEEVRQRLMQNHYVADVDVYVSPLQGAVTLEVREAQPVALWITDNGTRWLLPSGTAVEPRGQTPAGLLEVVDGGAVATAPGAALAGAIDADVLASAASLAERLPGIRTLRYNRQIGLNFQLQEQPYWVYWGDGSDVERKLENLAAAVQLLEAGTLEGTVIDVRFERPYVK